MIPRYNRPAIQSIWSDENKFKIWTEIECLIAEKLSELGEIPNKAAEDIRKKAKYIRKLCKNIFFSYFFQILLFRIISLYFFANFPYIFSILGPFGAL